MKKVTKEIVRSTKHTDIQQTPPRTPARMEGVVKNAGIKQEKKTKKKE